ncbi:MAG: ABC transporter substrate-binding protein [Candidatus Cloacimonetes bacterium]|nr:ABC transporter substrate-binding protein [Candidatus Cloacimonadota bacterium]
MQIKLQPLILLLLLLIVTATSCSNKQETSELKVAFSSFPETFDKITRNEHFTTLVNSNIFEYFLEYEHSTFKPILTSGWLNSSDSTIVFKIREGVHFHNGKLLDSQDVIESLNRALNSDVSLMKDPQMAEELICRIIDKFSIEFTYKSDFKSLMFTLAGLPIYNSEILSQFTDDEIAKNPVGTGKYYLSSNNDSLIVLEKFNRYWGEPASIDKIKIFKIKERADQLNAAYNGKIDLLMDLPVNEVKTLQKRSSFNIIEKTGNIVMYMMLDARRSKSPMIDLEQNPFTDIRVRKAIAHSIDTHTFVSRYLQYSAIVLSQPSLPESNGFNHSLTPIEYNPDTSSKLLKEAGYLNGFNLTIDCIQNKYPMDYELGEFIKNSLKNIGITAEICYNNSESFYNKLSESNSSAYITGFRNPGDYSFFSIFGLYHHDENKGLLNRFGNVDNELKILFDNHIDLEIDPELNEEAVLKIAEVAQNTFFVIPLYAPKELYLLSDKFVWNQFSHTINFSDFSRKDDKQ